MNKTMKKAGKRITVKDFIGSYRSLQHLTFKTVLSEKGS